MKRNPAFSFNAKVPVVPFFKAEMRSPKYCNRFLPDRITSSELLLL
ncbi:hypothetical protein PI95_006485 [Hassallia byssoidea VB512170]|uniref:Uncharacterized protein n=1 Tax=Hassallia byssoidea VB512170 TaxID=1304833 RepID=A0A846H5I4_9CYAN|nr:hypothetical protein [Hassalia byssoidea]NEU72228.1 hypothetical protein [Hassalia byssoidea VB512170]